MKNNYLNNSKRFSARNRVSQAAYLLLLFIWSGFLTPSIAQNYAVNFDGTDDYIGFTTSYPAYNNSTFTIEAWIKTTSSASSQVNDIVGWNGSGIQNAEFRVYNGKLEYGENITTWTAVTSSASVNTGNWTHVAVVKNGSSVTLYINGLLDGISTSFTQNPTITGMRIGSLNYSFPGLVYYFQGGIDEVRFWNTARSQSEISSNMYNQLAGGETGLVAYYPLLEGSGTTTNDAQTSSSYDGTLTNGPSWTAFDPNGNPGGVSGKSLWLKGDAGTNVSGSSLTGWIDQTYINGYTKTGTIGYNTNSINFNPSVTFDNTGTLTSLPDNRLDGNTNITVVNAFAVYKNSNYNSNFIGSVIAGGNYGPAIFASYGQNTCWVANGTSNDYSSFTASGLTFSFNVVEMDVSPTSTPYASGSFNGVSQNLTAGSGGDFTSITLQPMIGGTNNNGNSLGWPHAIGELAEVILYPSSLTSTQKRQVESYLAIKYGISLGNNTETAIYFNSAGTSIYASGTYKYDVFGIGKDDASGLNQTSSNSMSTGSGDGTGQSGKGNIVLSNASSLENNDFLLIGHDNGALTEQSSGLPTGFNNAFKRLIRQWITQHTGDAGTVTLKFSTLGLTISGTAANQLFLVIDGDTDGDLTTGTPVVKMADTYAGNVATFNSVTLTNNTAFTFASSTVREWTGTTSTDWANTGNWVGGQIPTAAEDVLIQAGLTNFPIVGSGTANAKRIAMAAGAKLDVATGATLAVADTLILGSDATNSASFINQGTFTGTLSYQGFLTGGATGPWHLVAAPVSGHDLWAFATAAGNSVAENAGKRAITTYNEGTDNWKTYPTASTGNLLPGTGYSMLRTADGTVTFSGSLNNADVTGLSLTRTAGTGFGWNLLGNPYPSAINATETADAANNLLTVNAGNFDPSYTALYLWDAASGAYVTISNTDATFPPTSNLPNHNYIQAGQGFFVKSKTDGGSFDITLNMRSHQTGVAFKSAETGWPAIQVQAAGGNKTSSTFIAFNSQMTNGLDVSYDAGMFKADKNFALYSRLVTDNGVDFAIQALPEFYDKLVIPLGIDVPAGTEITFSAQAANLPADAAVYLEDRAAKTTTQLDVAGAEYTVTITDKTKGTGNFFLHTKSATTAINQFENSLQVYTRDRAMYISGDINTTDVVSVTGINGKLHYKNAAAKTGLLRIDAAGMPAGVYLVNISNKTERVTKKVVITE